MVHDWGWKRICNSGALLLLLLLLLLCVTSIYNRYITLTLWTTRPVSTVLR